MNSFIYHAQALIKAQPSPNRISGDIFLHIKPYCSVLLLFWGNYKWLYRNTTSSDKIKDVHLEFAPSYHHSLRVALTFSSLKGLISQNIGGMKNLPISHERTERSLLSSFELGPMYDYLCENRSNFGFLLMSLRGIISHFSFLTAGLHFWHFTGIDDRFRSGT